MKLQELLEHPWITKKGDKILELRRKSSDQGDRLLQFMAYTNIDADSIRQHSPKGS